MGKGRFGVALGVLWVVGLAGSCAKAVAVTTCPSGQTSCNSVCVTVASDSDNCGACGNACPSGQACVNSACAVECPVNDIKCAKDGGSTLCVNAQTDNDNCGSCGHVCSAGQICYAGACSGTCGNTKSGETMCGDAGPPYCANLSVDPQNCGTCGHACAAGEVCVSGACQGTCDMAQTLCTVDGGAYCADLMTDNANCGSCGAPCTGPLDTCVGGSCGSLCAPNQIICPGDAGSYCVDHLTDNKNCGTCGTVCSGAKPLCSNGKCTTVSNTGTVYYTNGTTAPIQFVPCGNGTNTNCTETVAETSCTNIGRKLVSHASDGTAAVVSLGATVSCEWSISYFINNDPSVAGQCLIGMSNVYWTSCCTTTRWHGNVVTVPSTLGQQFGYVYSSESGYQSGFSNVTGTTWGCQALTVAPPARVGCSTYYVACL